MNLWFFELPMGSIPKYPVTNYYPIAVGTVSAQGLVAAPAKNIRAQLIFMNAGNNDVYAMPVGAGPATVGAGVWVLPGSEKTVILPGPGAWNFIANGGASNILAIEYLQ